MEMVSATEAAGLDKPLHLYPALGSSGTKTLFLWGGKKGGFRGLDLRAGSVGSEMALLLGAPSQRQSAPQRAPQPWWSRTPSLYVAAIL